MTFHKTFALRCASVALFVVLSIHLFYTIIHYEDDDNDSDDESSEMETKANDLIEKMETGLTTKLDGDPSRIWNNFSRQKSQKNVYKKRNLVTSKKEKKFPCVNKPPKRRIIQRGQYWVIENQVMASKKFDCDESITYTTNADFIFLDNLEPLIERWRGPISIAMYTPGRDFETTMKRINFVRECTKFGPLIKQLVNFHLFFESQFLPKVTNPWWSVKNGSKNNNFCKSMATQLNPNGKPSFRKQKGLLYPVNVARNIAKEASQTFYILASDIELYPGPVDLIQQFFEMLTKNESQELWTGVGGGGNPKVFVLPVFEVLSNVSLKDLPKNKMDLLKMLSEGQAFTFHRELCRPCHEIPEPQKWLDRTGNWAKRKGLGISHVGKRYKWARNWEPFYIGTIEDPAWDDRLSWEGRSNKMTQAFSLCLLNYDFLILDKAFLVHRPGIARRKAYDLTLVAKQDSLIKEQIKLELETLYNPRSGCYLLDTS